MSVRDRLDPADVERMFDRIAGPYDRAEFRSATEKLLAG